jgi:hypothetical protein
MQELAEAVAKTRHLGAAEIHLAIERHEELNGLHLRIAARQLAAVMNKLIGEILDCMPEDFEGVPCLRADAARALLRQNATPGNLGSWRDVDRKAGSC